jgi:chromosome segregation ATPase
LKATFARATALAARDLDEKLEAVRRILQAESQPTPSMRHALRYIDGIQTETKSGRPPATLSELAQIAKEAEVLNEKEVRLNKALEKKLEKAQSEVDDLENEIEQARKNLSDVTESRLAMREKSKTFVEQVKRRETQWKERYAALEAELEAQD